MRTFSSILPFTNRFGLRWTTCINGGGAIGGAGNNTLISLCPVWGSGNGGCAFCTPPQFIPNDNCVSFSCFRSGGDFEILREFGIGEMSAVVEERGRVIASGMIAQHNLDRFADSTQPICRLGFNMTNMGCLESHGIPSRDNRMDLVLRGLVYLCERHPETPPLKNENGWAFLMACSYSHDSERWNVAEFVRGLEEKKLVRFSLTGDVNSAAVTEKGRKYYKSLVEAIHKSPQENQGN